ncbi:hypothetical protein HOLleu_39629 [Holothuria leucospilota]|uniref:Uncharacterized protein n=1 Tax=Holothuria leucospilota TaxID=206669 RepID=A0A9Q0YKH3_HOLLE|nr:hypothetical protein HOLleu_39629 [Holothuria leucospilota]
MRTSLTTVSVIPNKLGPKLVIWQTKTSKNLSNPIIITWKVRNLLTLLLLVIVLIIFRNVGPSLAEKISSNHSPSARPYDSNPSSAFLSPISEDELKRISKSCLKSDKSAGFDEIRSSVVNRVICLILLPLTYVFNLSLSTGIVPDNLKIAKVVPIIKKGDPNCFVNYRPVSVLPCFSEILERTVYRKLKFFR